MIFQAKASGQPLPTLSWTMGDSKPLPNDPKKFKIESLGGGQSQLTIQQVSDNDLGKYACVAKNQGGSLQTSFTLEISRVSSGGIFKLKKV